MNEEKQKILDLLYSKQRLGIKPGLERTYALLDKLDDPHDTIKAVHIAGTNGKGSTASLIASVMQEAGYKTGLYTSPHLIDFNERIRINGKTINDDEIIRLANDILPAAEEIEATFFEITTAMAFKYFAEKQVDIAIIETGMGGRFDSTNVLTPIVSVITRIGMDHSEYLGDTLEKIAHEKAGIIKRGIPCVIGTNRADIKEFLIQRAIALLSPYSDSEINIHINNYNISKELMMNIDVSSTEEEYRLPLPLAGKHQLENTKTTIATIDELRFEFDIPYGCLITGFKNVENNTGITARTKYIKNNPPIILDSSHNQQSVEALVNLIKDSDNTRFDTLLFGAMKDKEIDLLLYELSRIAKSIIITQPKIERAASIEYIEKIARELDYEILYKSSNSYQAVQFAIARNKPFVITGSFYLSGEVLQSEIIKI